MIIEYWSKETVFGIRGGETGLVAADAWVGAVVARSVPTTISARTRRTLDPSKRIDTC
jgi:hypothetical protein